MLENKLNINNAHILAVEEERLTKLRAKELYELDLLDTFEVGTFKGLSMIHKYLFSDVYDFAGKVRTVNLSKGSFRFASALYIDDILKVIDGMPETNFDEIIEKYVEMNIAHPFCEGNGRSMRIWLDLMLKKRIGMVIDWQKVDKSDFLLAMERSPVKDVEIKNLLHNALTTDIHNREVYMKGIDVSYSYEGYETFKVEDITPQKPEKGPSQ